MKKLTYFFAALVAVASLATSCKPKNNPDSGKDVYALGAKAEIDKSYKDAEKVRSLVEEALRSAGFLLKGYDLILEGDSAAVASQLATKMQVVETAIKESKSECPVEITVRGVLKQDLEKENRHVCLFYHHHFGAVSDGVSSDGLYAGFKHSFRWVKWLRTDIGWIYDEDGDYFTQFGADINKGAGGDYLYLMLEHSGKADIDANDYEWDDEYADTYPTDLIVVYGSKPISIVVDDRVYYRQDQCYDLNYSTDKTPLYLYATTDPVPGYEGYYLNTGIGSNDKRQCRMLYSGSNFSASDYLVGDFEWNEHEYVDRVVQAYDADGNHLGEADCNHDAGGDFIKLIMMYCKHE